MPPASSRDPVPLLFVHYGADWIRGSERCLLDLLAHLDRDRYWPIVWCNAPTMARAVAALDVPVTESPVTILLDWAAPRFAVRSWATLVRQGLRLVREHDIRLIHANSGAPNQWMLPVARRARIPLVTHLHAIYDLRGRCIFGLHHVSRVIGVSHETIHGLGDDGVSPTRMRVIHNGIDVARLSAGDARGLRAEIGIPPDAVVAAAVGSLIPRKGFHVLLDAFARVRRVRPKTALLIVGDGPQRASLEAKIAELGLRGTVHLLGERQDVGAVFRDAADIAVSASFEEAFGLTVMEAAAMGLPVVATRVAGTAEVIQHGESGIIVPVDDPEALARGILALTDDPGLRRKYGEAGSALIEAGYTIRVNVEALCAVYDSALARPAREFGWLGPWGPVWPWVRLAARFMRNRLGLRADRRRRGRRSVT